MKYNEVSAYLRIRSTIYDICYTMYVEYIRNYAKCIYTSYIVHRTSYTYFLENIHKDLYDIRILPFGRFSQRQPHIMQQRFQNKSVYKISIITM